MSDPNSPGRGAGDPGPGGRGPEGPQAGEDAVVRLLRLAGARPAVPEERLERIRGVVHARWRETVRRDRRRLFIAVGLPLGAAAALAILVGVGFRLAVPGRTVAAATVLRTEGQVRRPDGRAVSPGSVLTVGDGVLTGADGRAALRLADGTSVRLDAGTGLRLVAKGGLSLDRGAVYVDTGGSAAGRRPPSGALEIRTRFGTITDRGTQFEARLREDLLLLSVREGAIRLTRDDRTTPAPAGVRLRVAENGVVDTAAVAPAAPDWDWTLEVAPPLDLEGRTLARYLDWLHRQTGWDVVFADAASRPALERIVLHGSTAGMRPDQTPEAILPACGLRFRREGGTLIVERAARAEGSAS